MKDTAINILTAQETSLFFLGQAGFVFKSKNGTTLGVDMYLTHCVEREEGHMGFKRLIPIILSPDEIIFDYIVATHPHKDHFDMDAIPTLMAPHHTKLFASVECEADMKRLKLTNENTVYVKPGEQADADDIHLEFVDCDHGIGTPDAFGLIITMDGRRIYIAGDTCLHLEQVPELGKIDVMIAPINGKNGNLSERECTELSKALKPGVTIPCHYGMFASHGGDPGVFKECMDAEKLNYLIMAPGERLEIR